MSCLFNNNYYLLYILFMSGQKSKVHLGPNVSSSAHHRGCVVNGSGAMAAI